MIRIRHVQAGDWPALWRVIKPVFRAGETYAFSPAITEEEARLAWLEKPCATFAAVDQSGSILGTYTIKPNQPTLGAHACNCGTIVS